jgi:phage repressor protein C with HTH and peptisase S24 domain
MATIGDRVRLVREQLGISQSRLAKAVKIAPQTIQQLEAGDSQGSKHLLAIARELRVNPDWLLTGKGDQGSPSAAAMRNNVVEIRGDEFALLPVYEIRFAAGAGALVDDDESPIDHYLISLASLRGMTKSPLDQIGVFQVDGDSMEPTINNRDWVFVDRRRTRLTNPGIYCLNFEGDALIKRAAQHLESGVVTLISDNAAYPAQTIKKVDRLVVIGRVFLSIRRH